MPFDINDVPFYKAVDLFESEKYQESFEIFVDCAEKGDLYAAFYVEYLIKNQSDSLKIPEKYQAFVKSFHEYMEMIPRAWKPEAWCQASVCIVKIKRQLKESPNVAKRLLIELGELIKIAPNAVMFYYRNPEKVNPKFTKEKAKELGFGALLYLLTEFDIFSVYHLSQLEIALPKKYLEKFAKILQQIKLEGMELQKAGAIAIKHHGAPVERLFSRYYNGPVMDATGTKVEKGSPFEKDSERCLAWQKAAALHGNKELQLALYKARVVYGRLTEISQEEAHLWLAMAAQNGDGEALISCGIKAQSSGNHYHARRYFATALYGKGASSLSDVQKGRGLICLGSMQEHGEGGFAADDTGALTLYQEAQKVNAQYSFANEAVFYKEGRGGLEKSYLHAAAFFEKEIEINGKHLSKEEIADYHTEIGLLYLESGFGLKPDLTKAIRHFTVGMNSNSVARCNYALMLFNGEGVSQNVEGAIPLLLPFANEGNIEVITTLLLGIVQSTIVNPSQYGLTETKIRRYLTVLRQSERDPSFYTGDKVDRYFLMGLVYYKYLPSSPDYKNAFDCFKLGEKNHDSNCMVHLGSIYEHGCPQLKIAIDPKRAFDFYNKAAEMGDVQGLNNRGSCLLNGFAVEADPVRAKTDFLAALSKGHKIAALNLGTLYYNGNGVAKDVKQAYEYYKMAESTEDLDVLYALGVCHHLGEGCQQNDEIACRYFARANEKGHLNAGYNYAAIKLQNAIESDYIEEANLVDALSKLELGRKQGHPESIYLHGMFRLLLDTSVAETVAQEFKASLAKKPHKQMDRALSLLNYRLEQKKKVSTVEILILFTTGVDLIKLLEEAKKAADKQEPTEKPEQQTQQGGSVGEGQKPEQKRDQEQEVKRDKDKGSSVAPEASKPRVKVKTRKPALGKEAFGNGSAHEETSGEIASPKPLLMSGGPSKGVGAETEVLNSSKLERLKREIDWFTDPLNKKSINIKQFKSILGKVSLQAEVELAILPSKGSNRRFSLTRSDFDKNIRFSSHPIHRPGQGQASAYDPGRAQDLQRVMREVKRVVFE